MPEFDLKEMLEALGATAENLSDGTIDDGDIEVLEWAVDYLELLIREGITDDLQKPLVKKILKGIAIAIELGLSDVGELFMEVLGGDDDE